MNKMYVSKTFAVPAGKVIPMYGTHISEWITAEEAAKLFRSGKGISVRSLMNKVYGGKLPKDAFVHSPAGWRFHLPSLLGLRGILVNDAAA